MVSYRYNSFQVDMVDCYWIFQFYHKPVRSCFILAKKKARIYAGCGVSQMPIYYNEMEEKFMKFVKCISVMTTVLTLASGVLTGCGGNPAAAASTESVNTSQGAYAGQTLKLAVLEGVNTTEMWGQIIEAFEAKTGATVEFSTSKDLDGVIAPQLKAGNFYDVIYLPQNREKALPETMLKENAVLEITDVLDMKVMGEDVTVGEKILPGFIGNLSTNPYGDDKVYMMPMAYYPCGLFYNKSNFTENGGELELPATWDEFFALSAQTDIPLFAYPHGGYLDSFTYAMIAEIGGLDFFEKAMRYDEEVWNSSEIDQMFDILGKLAANTNPSVTSNTSNANYPKNSQKLLDNEALFLANGTWVVDEMADAPRVDGFEWGFMPLPAMEDGGDRCSYTLFQHCWIPAGAENPELGKLFMTYLYSDEAVNVFSSIGGLSLPVAGMTEKLPAEKQLFYSMFENGVTPVVGAFTITAPVEGVSINNELCFTIDSVVNGTKTVDEWKANTRKAIDALREAL